MQQNRDDRTNERKIVDPKKSPDKIIMPNQPNIQMLCRIKPAILCQKL